MSKIISVHSFDIDDVISQAEQTYCCEVAAVFRHSDEMMALASSGIFALKYPDDPITKPLEKLADRLKP